jgi:chemotaxis signal transduction protein
MAQGGVMFRIDAELCFLPASIALKVVPTPAMARVPGGPPELRGVALVDGDMIAVFELGAGRGEHDVGAAAGAMLVCTLLGERLGLVGLEIVATGRFESDPTSGELRHGGETARVFDLGALIVRVRDGRWAV